jgi:hypothetical protein
MKGFWREFRSRSRCGGASILQELAAIGFADIRKAVNNTKCGRAYALPLVSAPSCELKTCTPAT